jgi:hypothetical protein
MIRNRNGNSLLRKMYAGENMLSFERQRMPQSKLMAAWWLLPPVSVIYRNYPTPITRRRHDVNELPHLKPIGYIYAIFVFI